MSNPSSPSVPLVGKGGAVTFGSVAIANLASWSVGISAKLTEVKGLAYATRRQIPYRWGWTCEVDWETPTLTRDAGSIAVGTWAGIDLVDATFELDCVLQDVSAAGDAWQVCNPVEMDWKLTADRWETNTNYQVFLGLIEAQEGSGALVTVASPAGGGATIGVISKASLRADPSAQKGALEVTSGVGTAPTPGSVASGLFGYVSAAVSDVLDHQYSPPLALSLTGASGHTAAGNAFLRKLTIQMSQSLVKGKCSFQGSGPLTTT